VTSPGGLYNGLTYEEIMNGHSRLRNRTIANAFCQMGLVESWGTGIRRIREAAAKYGLPEPEFQVFDNMFRVNLFRDNSLISNLEFGRETSEKHRRNFGENLNNTQKKVLALLTENASLSASDMAGQIGVTSRSIETNIKKLKERGILIRHGSPKGGYWEIRN